MNPTTIKYGLMALAFIGWTAGVYFYATGHEARIWKAAIAEQKSEAADLLTDLTEKARAKEAAHAETARNIDVVYQAMLNDAFAGNADFDKRLRDARRRASCPNTGSGQASDTGVGSTVAPSSDDGLGKPDPASDLRDALKELQRYSVACHGFALSVGR